MLGAAVAAAVTGGVAAAQTPPRAANGTANYTTTTNRFTLGAGTTSLFDADGSSIVIHADPDDHVTDPTGNSGARIACGTIIAGAAALPATGGGTPVPVAERETSIL